MSTVSPTLSTAALLSALRACRFFESLGSVDMQRIAAFAKLRRVAKGEYLFREGEPTRGFFVTHSGAISVQRTAPDGREKIIHVFRAGESFAEATLPDGAGYPANACCIEEGSVLFIPRSEFMELLKTRPDLSLRMLASMSQHLRVLVNALDDLTQKDVETRMALWLLKRCPKPLTSQIAEIALDGTKSRLAAELRIRSETLSRVIARMRALNLISSKGRTIHVLDPLHLDSWLGEHSTQLS